VILKSYFRKAGGETLIRPLATISHLTREGLGMRAFRKWISRNAIWCMELNVFQSNAETRRTQSNAKFSKWIGTHRSVAC